MATGRVVINVGYIGERVLDRLAARHVCRALAIKAILSSYLLSGSRSRPTTMTIAPAALA